eukprot:5832550-Lingulodinium_polyedra.AAC.1
MLRDPALRHELAHARLDAPLHVLLVVGAPSHEGPRQHPRPVARLQQHLVHVNDPPNQRRVELTDHVRNLHPGGLVRNTS